MTTMWGHGLPIGGWRPVGAASGQPERHKYGLGGSVAAVQPADTSSSYWAPTLFLDPSAVVPGRCCTVRCRTGERSQGDHQEGVDKAREEQEDHSDEQHECEDVEQTAEQRKIFLKTSKSQEQHHQLHRWKPPGPQTASTWHGSGGKPLIDGQHCRVEDVVANDMCPKTQVAAVGAFVGLLLGLRVAFGAGLTHGTPPLAGVLSAVLAAGGTVSCVLSLCSLEGGDVVALPPSVVVGLACLCSALAPLPLAPWSNASLAGAVDTARIALPGAIGGVVLFEIGHRLAARIDPCRVAMLKTVDQGVDSLQVIGSDAVVNMRRVFQLWWSHFSPRGDRCGVGGVGSMYFAAHLALTYFSVHIELALTQWKNGFFASLQGRNSLAFYNQLWDFVPIAMASTLANIYSGYLATMWDLRWREELTRDFMRTWLDHKAYYLVRFTGQSPGGAIDNFDQRIVEDTALFAGSSRGLLCGAAEALIRLCVFGPALVRLSPTPLVWQSCLALAMVSSILTHLVGRPLASQNASLQRAEADLRSALMRLRLFAEDIALQHGEAAEGASADRCFENVKAATWSAARGTFNLVTFTSAYGLAGGVLPFLVLVPSYFHGDMTLGSMFQLESVVGGVRASLEFFIGAYGDIAAWRASASRLLALEACVVDTPSRPILSRRAAGDAAIRAEGLVIATTGKAVVLKDISFHWRSGDCVAIDGPTGSGKSALLRALAGAWPPPLAGRITSGGSAGGVAALLVSASGFLLPPRATLRMCLAYPEAIAAFDEDVRTALIECGLEGLAGQLDREADWLAELSVSDRQRLAFVRLIVRWPAGVQWLLLDDVDGTLDGPEALSLYERLGVHRPASAGMVVVSRHREVVKQLGWRQFHINRKEQTLVENVLAGTGEAPSSVEIAEDC